MPVSDVIARRMIQLQSFKEVTWGTGAAATSKWAGVKYLPTFTPKSTVQSFEEARGSFVPAYDARLMAKGGEFKIPMWATYEDMIYVLAGAYKGDVVGVGTAPTVWAYPAPTTTFPTLQSYAFEYAYGAAYIKATSCFINKFSIKAEASQGWEMECSGILKDLDYTPTGSPAALSTRAAQVITMPDTQFFLDNIGATPGTTDLTNLVYSFGLEVDIPIKPIFTAGSLMPTHWTIGDAIKPKLTLGLLASATAQTFIESLAGGQGLLAQIKATSGTKYCKIDFSGFVSKDIELYGDREGAAAYTIELDPVYDTVNSLYNTITLANAVTVMA